MMTRSGVIETTGVLVGDPESVSNGRFLIVPFDSALLAADQPIGVRIPILAIDIATDRPAQRRPGDGGGTATVSAAELIADHAPDDGTEYRPGAAALATVDPRITVLFPTDLAFDRRAFDTVLGADIQDRNFEKMIAPSQSRATEQGQEDKKTGSSVHDSAPLSDYRG